MVWYTVIAAAIMVYVNVVVKDKSVFNEVWENDIERY